MDEEQSWVKKNTEASDSEGDAGETQNGIEAGDNNSPALACNPSVPEEMEAELEKIKGDMIGDTVYTERWVLKCLMNITKKFPEYCKEDEEVKELDSAFEEDVCTIWDMAIDKDVTKFLMKHNILNLIEAIISECKNPRLMEMMLGIIGNLGCQSEARREIAAQKSLIAILAATLEYTDARTLIQLVRLIKTCLWDLRNLEAGEIPKDNFWVESLAHQSCSDSLMFIIRSSCDEDLVFDAIKLLETLVFIRLPKEGEFLGKYFANAEAVASLLEGLREVSSSSEKSDFGVINRNVEDVLIKWVSILYGLTLCANGEAAIRAHAENNLVFVHLITTHVLEKENFKECIDEYSDFIMCVTTVMNLLMPTDFHEGCLASAVTMLDKVQAAEGVQASMLSTLSQCHAPEVELCFLAISKQDRALLTQLLAELKCINKTDRLCEIAKNILKGSH
ncbi:Hypothetical predicted protein [Cloeon dipterum]|uniref:Uncharacterized protein n=1 Tax=Cloeon dipterum TaxID=197152 RepID=A0A8S1CDJ8_9INSE|nr:Hypothetical predicted protein [Cloeon dipterum]